MVKCPKCGNDMTHDHSTSDSVSDRLRHVTVKLEEYYECPLCNSSVVLCYEKDVEMT